MITARAWLAFFVVATVEEGCSCSGPVDTRDPEGYAIVTGSLPDVLGYPTTTDVRAHCRIVEGEEEIYATAESYRAGEYRVELEWSTDASPEGIEAAEWEAVCTVEAPASGPPYAAATDTVLFTERRADRVTTTIDLLPADS